MKKNRSTLLLAALSLASPLSAVADTQEGACAGARTAGETSLTAVAAAVAAGAPLDSAPGARRFADTWSQYFAAAIREAAGKDGRLTRSEAAKLAARCDVNGLFGDNAVNWLQSAGQQSVSAEKLIGLGWAYAAATGGVAAGADGRISLADAAKLPLDLRDDYAWLRGKLDRNCAPPAQGDVVAALRAATTGMMFPSESDAKLVVLESPSSGSGAITADEVAAAFGAAHDSLMRGGTDVWNWPDAGYALLADRHPAIRDAAEWLERYATYGDPADPASMANAAKFAALRDVLSAGLTDLTVVRFDQEPPPSSAITTSIFVVGRTADGRLVAVLTGGVET